MICIKNNNHRKNFDSSNASPVRNSSSSCCCSSKTDTDNDTTPTSNTISLSIFGYKNGKPCLTLYLRLMGGSFSRPSMRLAFSSPELRDEWVEAFR